MIKKKFNYLLAGTSWLFLFVISMFLKPHGDDFEFLYYFKNGNWNVGGYHWLNDCILLPRNYWRPIEDVLFTFEAHFPYLYPYLHHAIIVTLCVISACLVYRLGGVLRLKQSIRYVSSVFLLFASTSMGTTLDVGGFIQVLATCCGLASILFWLHKDTIGYISWFICCFIACFSKETGFIWFPIAPLFAALLEVKEKHVNIYKGKNLIHVLKTLIVPVLGIVLYLIAYVSVTNTDIAKVASGSSNTEKVAKNAKGNEKSALFTTDVSTHDYSFTPASLAKNIFVCWVAALYPIDTTAIYQKDFSLIALTGILGLIPFLLILYYVIRYIRNHSFPDWSLLFWMLLIVSSVSLILRAGEISAYPSVAILALIIGLVLNDVKWSCKSLVVLVMFTVSTLIVDAHKYYMCYWAAKDADTIGKELKSETKDPSNVLLIQYGDWTLKKDGAFVRNLVYDFFDGGAAIAAYDYKKPTKLSIKNFIGKNFYSLKKQAYSEAVQNKSKYSAIWIVSEKETTVINH